MRRAFHGRLALAVGARDYDKVSDLEAGIDTVVNVLHALHERGAIGGPGDAESMLGLAVSHFNEEVGTEDADRYYGREAL